MSEPKRDVRGMLASAAFIVIAALAIYHSREFSALGAVFPRTIAGALIVLSLVYITFAWLKPAPQKKPEAGSVWRRAALAVTMLAWALLLEPLGFLATSILCYAVILVIANYDRWTPRRAVVYAAVGAAVLGGLYSIFRFGLQVPLPQGILM